MATVYKTIFRENGLLSSPPIEWGIRISAAKNQGLAEIMQAIVGSTDLLVIVEAIPFFLTRTCPAETTDDRWLKFEYGFFMAIDTDLPNSYWKFAPRAET